MKYREKSTPVEAVQFTRENIDEVVAFCGEEFRLVHWIDNSKTPQIITIDHVISPGEWVVREFDGTLHKLSDGIFHRRYEAV